MHLFDAARNFMGGFAIVGGQIPIAAGLALAAKYRDEERVVLCFLGDGAVNQGEFHESMNLASLWKLPVLFLLENNLYGMGTHVERTHAGGRDIYTTAEAYRIPAAQIDGMNVVEVGEATVEALKRVRSGSGPVFIEAMTYRFRGHSMADPSAYRDDVEVEEWRSKDPIETLKVLSLEEGLMDEEKISAIEEEVAATIGEAERFAEESPEPDVDSLLDNVYA
jgi:pyruvate dehydrogenase E1 component alpha subunit